ncbi:hypothetical protein V2J09_021125 [Rumex salicifolius]
MDLCSGITLSESRIDIACLRRISRRCLDGAIDEAPLSPGTKRGVSLEFKSYGDGILVVVDDAGGSTFMVEVFPLKQRF